MLRQQHLIVTEANAAFEPEGGAYAATGHAHGHSHHDSAKTEAAAADVHRQDGDHGHDHLTLNPHFAGSKRLGHFYANKGAWGPEPGVKSCPLPSDRCAQQDRRFSNEAGRRIASLDRRSMSCSTGSSAFATTACLARHSRPGSSPQRARRWSCLRSTPKPARKLRPSSSTWPGSKPAALPEPPALTTRALADDCRAQSRTGLRRRSQGCRAHASQPRCQRAMPGAAMTSPRPRRPWPASISAPTSATKSALTPAVTPAAPALGRRSANTAATAIASPTMAPAKAVNAGSDLAIDADQPTARDKR